MNEPKKVILPLLLIIILGSAILILLKINENKQKQELTNLSQQQKQALDSSSSDTTSQSIQPNQDKSTKEFLVFPIDNFATRISQKSFGTYTAQQGYRTGIDIEINQNEISNDVPVYTIANATVKKITQDANKGGTVVLEAKINSQYITITYSYLKITSVVVHEGDGLKRGQKFAILGNANSIETANQRKHLSFSIKKGQEINTDEYTQKKSDLSNWENPQTFLINAIDASEIGTK